MNKHLLNLTAFLDMSKAFDKVWYEELVFKLESMTISKSCLKWPYIRVVPSKSRCTTRIHFR